MPTYQYACTECGHAFEQVQSFSDDALTVCPECQGKLRKVFNAVGVVFKGSGFYRTDSRVVEHVGGRTPRPERRRDQVRAEEGAESDGSRLRLEQPSDSLRRREPPPPRTTARPPRADPVERPGAIPPLLS